MMVSHKSLLMLLMWLVLSGFTLVHAQEKAATEEKPQTVVSESGDTTTTSEDEDKAQPTVIDSIASVKKVSESLKDRFQTVVEALEDSQNAKNAKRELETVLELANEALSLFSEDSDIWTYTAELIDTYRNHARNAESQAQQGKIGGPFTKQWRDIAALWHEKKDELKKIQGELRVLRKKNQALLGELPFRQKILEQYIALGMAEKAIAELKFVVKDMQSLQAGLSTVIGGLEKVSPGKAPL